MNSTLKQLSQGTFITLGLFFFQATPGQAVSVGTANEVGDGSSQIVDLSRYQQRHSGNGPRGHHGGRPGMGHGPKLSTEQKDALDACLQQQGITQPTPPSEEVRAAMDACRAENPQASRDSLELCIVGKGVAVPQIQAGFRQAMENCRSQLGVK